MSCNDLITAQKHHVTSQFNGMPFRPEALVMESVNLKQSSKIQKTNNTPPQISHLMHTSENRRWIIASVVLIVELQKGGHLGFQTVELHFESHVGFLLSFYCVVWLSTCPVLVALKNEQLFGMHAS
jgi:hypothetical protein